MTPWFDDMTMNRIGGFIGSAIGILGGTLGATAIIFIRKGWRKIYFTLYTSIILVGLSLAITGLIAIFMKQPFIVWYGFLLPGAITTILLLSLLPVINKRFTDFEILQMKSHDL